MQRKSGFFNNKMKQMKNINHPEEKQASRQKTGAQSNI